MSTARVIPFRRSPGASQADLAVSLEAFELQEHARRVGEETARLRALASIARDSSRPLIDRCEAVLQGLGLSRVLWVSASGKFIYPRDGKRVEANRNAVTQLVEALPKVGLVGVVAGQDVAVTLAPVAIPPPPCEKRALLAGDREYQSLRWPALEAFGELAGNLGAGVISLGGPALSERTRRELTDLAKDLSVATQEPSRGAVPRVAAMCAQAARDVAVEQPLLAGKAWKAAEACLALGRYADEWAIAHRAGGAR